MFSKKKKNNQLSFFEEMYQKEIKDHNLKKDLERISRTLKFMYYNSSEECISSYIPEIMSYLGFLAGSEAFSLKNNIKSSKIHFNPLEALKTCESLSLKIYRDYDLEEWELKTMDKISESISKIKKNVVNYAV